MYTCIVEKLEVSTVFINYLFLTMNDKPPEAVGKLPVKSLPLRTRMFWFLIGVSVANYFMFNKTYLFCQNRLNVLKSEMETLRNKISSQN